MIQVVVVEVAVAIEYQGKPANGLSARLHKNGIFWCMVSVRGQLKEDRYFTGMSFVYTNTGLGEL